jgi:hypothetical protein
VRCRQSGGGGGGGGGKPKPKYRTFLGARK